MACEHRVCAEGTDDAEWPRITPSSERQKPEGLAVPRDEAFLSGKRLTGFSLVNSHRLLIVRRLGNKSSRNSAAFVTLATLLPAVLSRPCFLLGVLIVTD